MLPFALALGHANEVGAEEHAGDAVDLERGGGERRAFALGGIAEFHGSFAEHGPAGQEFQGGRVGRRFGLNKHRLLSSVTCGWPEKAPHARLEWFEGILGSAQAKVKAASSLAGTKWNSPHRSVFCRGKKSSLSFQGKSTQKIGMGLEAYSRERARTMTIASELLLVVQDQAGCG